MADMRKTFAPRVDRSQLLLEPMATRYLLVGTCETRFAGIAKFLPDKVIYAFEHPTHRHVEMHMAYADMLNARTSNAKGGGGEFCFRIGRELEYFVREYNPEDAGHALRIGFASEVDYDRFRERVLPHVQGLAK